MWRVFLWPLPYSDPPDSSMDTEHIHSFLVQSACIYILSCTPETCGLHRGTAFYRVMPQRPPAIDGCFLVVAVYARKLLVSVERFVLCATTFHRAESKDVGFSLNAHAIQ